MNETQAAGPLTSFLLGISAALACFLSVKGARSRDFAVFIWEERQKLPRRDRTADQESFEKAMPIVFWAMAGAAALISVLCAGRLVVWAIRG